MFMVVMSWDEAIQFYKQMSFIGNYMMIVALILFFILNRLSPRNSKVLNYEIKSEKKKVIEKRNE